jgi:type VI secretion system protein VasG
MSTNLKALIGKLNDTTRKAMEASAGLCVARTHYDIEIEHFLLKALDASDNDVAAILKHYGIDRSRLTKELERSLDSLKTGNARSPAFSPAVVTMLSESWTVASIDFNAGSIRTGFTILALLGNDELFRIVKDISKELQTIPAEGLRASFYEVVATSREMQTNLATADAGATELGFGGESAGGSARGGKTPQSRSVHRQSDCERQGQGKDRSRCWRAIPGDSSNDRYSDAPASEQSDSDRRGRGGQDGGGGGLRECASSLVATCRRRCRDVHRFALSIWRCCKAGAGVKGEFENRLKGLINEVKSSTDADHSFYRRSAHHDRRRVEQAGQNDAANLLKPALARGELRTIAATTWSEYKKYFEKDPALASAGFQLVKVEEPTETQVALLPCCGASLPPLSKSTTKSGYWTKACSPASSSRTATCRIASCRTRPSAFSTRPAPAWRWVKTPRRRPLRTPFAPSKISPCRPASWGGKPRRARITRNGWPILRRKGPRPKRTSTTLLTAAVGEGKRDLIAKHSRNPLAAGNLATRPAPAPPPTAADAISRMPALMLKCRPAPDPLQLRAQLAGLNDELAVMQGEAPLMRVCCGCPDRRRGHLRLDWNSTWQDAARMKSRPCSRWMQHLGETRVIGQDHALAVNQRREFAPRERVWTIPVKPVGVFLLVGPSGVGKTETAHCALRRPLYGGERNMITINMSEFQEAHTVSTLKGSPPGYVGYGEGGVLTEAVRRRPYSVVLLDEVEKAHPDVLELFFQVFDKGQNGRWRRARDRLSRTRSSCSPAMPRPITVMKLTADPETAPSTARGWSRRIKPELDKVFKPAFLGRLMIVPYFPIRDEALKQIIRAEARQDPAEDCGDAPDCIGV